jgi:hypothetical protein
MARSVRQEIPLNREGGATMSDTSDFGEISGSEDAYPEVEVSTEELAAQENQEADSDSRTN